MSLPNQLEHELQQRGRNPTPGPLTISLRDAQGNQLEVRLASLDSLGCAVEELTLTLPALAQQSSQNIQQWAQALCQKITYLLEQIGPLEFDPLTGEALIRSTKPSQLPQGTQYYEFQLKPQSHQSVTLQRYRAVAGQPGRQPVPMQLTHEVLVKLVQDLLDTAPLTP